MEDIFYGTWGYLIITKVLEYKYANETKVASYSTLRIATVAWGQILNIYVVWSKI